MLVLRSVATNVQPRSPFFIFPRDAGEERDGGMIDLNDCAQMDARVDCRLESFGPAQDRLREGSAFKMSPYRMQPILDNWNDSNIWNDWNGPMAVMNT
jgi:hypothetical protein